MPILGPAIPLVSPERLMEDHRDTIERMIDAIEPDTPSLKEALWETILHLVEWVHLLPASETHHHSYKGGLLEHSLEVALWAAQSARGRLGELSLPGWERRRQERSFVLATALSGLLHDLGKPVADLLVLDPSGRAAWNPYRSSLIGWAMEAGIDQYHLQWLKGRGVRHRGFSLLILRSVVEPELFDRMREVGPHLEASLLGALTQDPHEDDPVAQLVSKADQESAGRSLRDPRRNVTFGGPAPELLLIHAMRQLVTMGHWIANAPGTSLWLIEEEAYLTWPQAAADIRRSLERDAWVGIPMEPDLLLTFMKDRGLLAPMEGGEPYESPILHVQPEILEGPLRMICLRHPRLVFEGSLPVSLGHQTRTTIENDESLTLKMTEGPLSDSHATADADNPEESNKVHGIPDTPMRQGHALMEDIQKYSDRFEWQVRDHHLFIPHPETAKAMGMEPLALIAELESEDWLVPGASGSLRKVRVIEGRRGLLLKPGPSLRLLEAMKVPKRKSRRKSEA